MFFVKKVVKYVFFVKKYDFVKKSWKFIFFLKKVKKS